MTSWLWQMLYICLENYKIYRNNETHGAECTKIKVKQTHREAKKATYKTSKTNLSFHHDVYP